MKTAYAATVRNAYAQAAQLAALTGRPVEALYRWAACFSGSTDPDKVAFGLDFAERRFRCNQELPRDFPEPVKEQR